MSSFPGFGQVATKVSANILLLEDRQPTGLGDSNGSGSCLEWLGDKERASRDHALVCPLLNHLIGADEKRRRHG